jgi:hypothetical protein
MHHDVERLLTDLTSSFGASAIRREDPPRHVLAPAACAAASNALLVRRFARRKSPANGLGMCRTAILDSDPEDRMRADAALQLRRQRYPQPDQCVPATRQCRTPSERGAGFCP